MDAKGAQVEQDDKAAIDNRMLELLCCPITKGALVFDAGRSELISKAAGLAYPIRDGIPIMLPSEARQIEPAK